MKLNYFFAGVIFVVLFGLCILDKPRTKATPVEKKETETQQQKRPESPKVNIIHDSAMRWNFHPAILEGIAYLESSNRHLRAVAEPNRTQSYGMFQINDVLANDENIAPEEIINDPDLGAHLAGKRIAYFCKQRINKGRNLKEQLEIAYGCYRGAKKDSRLFLYLKNSGKIKNIKSFWGKA